MDNWEAKREEGVRITLQGDGSQWPMSSCWTPTLKSFYHFVLLPNWGPVLYPIGLLGTGKFQVLANILTRIALYGHVAAREAGNIHRSPLTILEIKGEDDYKGLPGRPTQSDLLSQSWRLKNKGSGAFVSNLSAETIYFSQCGYRPRVTSYWCISLLSSPCSGSPSLLRDLVPSKSIDPII